MAREIKKIQSALRDFALAFPGATEDFPWGERVAKVAKKVFAFLGRDEESGGMSLCVKLPESGNVALSLPFAQPAGYGLGKSGWVMVTFAKGEVPPVDLLKEWIEESYRAVAPKKLIAARAAKPPRARAKAAPEAAPARKAPRRPR